MIFSNRCRPIFLVHSLVVTTALWSLNAAASPDSFARKQAEIGRGYAELASRLDDLSILQPNGNVDICDPRERQEIRNSELALEKESSNWLRSERVPETKRAPTEKRLKELRTRFGFTALTENSVVSRAVETACAQLASESPDYVVLRAQISGLSKWVSDTSKTIAAVAQPTQDEITLAIQLEQARRLVAEATKIANQNAAMYAREVQQAQYEEANAQRKAACSQQQC